MEFAGDNVALRYPSILIQLFVGPSFSACVTARYLPTKTAHNALKRVALGSPEINTETGDDNAHYRARGESFKQADRRRRRETEARGEPQNDPGRGGAGAMSHYPA